MESDEREGATPRPINSSYPRSPRYSLIKRSIFLGATWVARAFPGTTRQLDVVVVVVAVETSSEKPLWEIDTRPGILDRQMSSRECDGRDGDRGRCVGSRFWFRPRFSPWNATFRFPNGRLSRCEQHQRLIVFDSDADQRRLWRCFSDGWEALCPTFVPTRR